MVRTVLSLCLALGLGGSVLLAQETKQEKGTTSAKAAKGPSGEVGRYSAKSKSITLVFASASQKYKISDDAKVLDANGEESKDGLKDKRLTSGARVHLVLDDGGKSVKEIHLLPAATTGRSRRRPAQAGKPAPEDTKSKDDKSKSDQKKSDDKKDDKSGGK
jgi:hypothetical protein